MELKKEQAEKLEEYISGLKELGEAVSFPVGAVLADNATAKETLKVFKKHGISVIFTEEKKHPDQALREILDSAVSGRTLGIALRGKLDPKIYNALYSLSRGGYDARLAGDKSPRKVSVAPGAKAVLIMEAGSYESGLWGELISSVCRL